MFLVDGEEEGEEEEEEEGGRDRRRRASRVTRTEVRVSGTKKWASWTAAPAISWM